MTKQNQTKLKPKKPYTPPKLIHFGTLRSLTMAGAGGDY
jgi:hypothetical protein